MEDLDALYQHVRYTMIQVMAVLWRNGHQEFHVGAMMRLLGVPDEAAAIHDDERIVIDENFAKLLAELNIQSPAPTHAPPGVTLH